MYMGLLKQKPNKIETISNELEFQVPVSSNILEHTAHQGPQTFLDVGVKSRLQHSCWGQMQGCS